MDLEQQIENVKCSIATVSATLSQLPQGSRAHVATKSHLETLRYQLGVLKSQRSER